MGGPFVFVESEGFDRICIVPARQRLGKHLPLSPATNADPTIEPPA
jgi:hypothetical protein